jgi:hypothetical protein
MLIRSPLLLALACLALLAAMPALAQTLRIIPVPPGVKPQWQAVPGAPQVFFAPNLPTDVFRHQKKYYLYWDGMWFESRTLQGPWERPRQAPLALTRISPSYFKMAGRKGAYGPGPGPPPYLDGPPSVPGRPWTPPDPAPAEPIPPFEVTPEPSQPPAPWIDPAPGKTVPRAM